MSILLSEQRQTKENHAYFFVVCLFERLLGADTFLDKLSKVDFNYTPLVLNRLRILQSLAPDCFLFYDF